MSSPANTTDLYSALPRDKGQFIKEYLKSSGNQLTLFNQGLEVMIEKQQKAMLKTLDVCGSLSEIAVTEKDPLLKTALDSLQKELRVAEEARNEMVGRMVHHVSDRFDAFRPRLQIQQDNLKRRQRLNKEFVSKVNGYQSRMHRKNAKQKDIEHARQLYIDEQQRMKATETELNISLCKFEQERVEDMKVYLEKTVMAHIHFYARAIEGLSTAYKYTNVPEVPQPASTQDTNTTIGLGPSSPPNMQMGR